VQATKTEPASRVIQSVPRVTYLRALGCTSDLDIYTRFWFVARDRWDRHYEKLFYNTLQGIMTRVYLEPLRQ
jgi:hypothetical protein